MNLRKFTIPAILLLALGLSSCGTVRRAAKDVSFAATTPIWMIYGGGVDGYATAKEVRAGLGTGPATEVIVMPFAFVGHAVKHFIYGVVHAVDFFVFPVYGAAELHPYGPEVRPLQIYSNTWFDEDESASGTDAESGESR